MWEKNMTWSFVTLYLTLRISQSVTENKSQETSVYETFLCTIQAHSFKDLAVSSDFCSVRINLVTTNSRSLPAEIRADEERAGAKGKNVGTEVACTGCLCRGCRRLIYRLNLRLAKARYTGKVANEFQKGQIKSHVWFEKSANLSDYSSK